METLKDPDTIKKEQREHWIDLARAIGIILVVLAHALPKNKYMWIWINLFHMPLFFYISGYLYSCKSSFLSYIERKVRTLWVPFEVASFVTYIVFVLFGHAVLSIKDIVKIFLMITYGPLLGATWFIPVLLFTSVFYDVLFRIVKKIDHQGHGIRADVIISIVSVALLIIGMKTSVPYRDSVIMRSIFFFQVGYLMRKFLKNRKYDFILGVFLMVIVTVAAKFNKTSYLNNTYTFVSLYLLAAIAGSIGICLLCRWFESYVGFEKLSVFLYMGKNTMGPLIWQFVTFKIIIAVQILVYGLTWDRIQDFPVIYEYAFGLWVLIDVIVGIYGSILIYKIINTPIDRIVLKVEKKLVDKESQ